MKNAIYSGYFPPTHVVPCRDVGTWGIFFVNGSLYFQTVLSASPLQVVVWYIPIGVAELVVSVIEEHILHLVPGHILMLISGLAAVGSQLLLALMPPSRGSY
ncbi:hypothetical protein P168DRAFT_320371 [Aspergillus campestris IBT 28561]|uniref:Uncharacterized protein n=1 Tax=Aspergillus campestris (strain IBT 28561) TaxID=1392248 RepID=A0A2I1CYZ0_ASPC2|nr:uncharacterized protein P168DRAFT_320371 [Aspergillus campestris IBT 28561]PKY02831.1 hypothetical protein P168DRAFT_320371 [Aspergillus campestris IBT 28561]